MFRFFIYASLFKFILLGSIFCWAQSEDSFKKDSFKNQEPPQSQDFTFTKKHISPVLYRGSDQTSLLTLVSAAFAVGLSAPQDDSLRSEWKDHQKMDSSTSHIGDLMGTGAVAVVSSGLEYYFDERSYVYQSHLRGLAYGGLSIYTLKTAFARPRPGNSNNHQSFPSGHSSIAFMSATHLSYAYGWRAAVWAYPVAAFVGASRLADDVHWFSDTVAGAFLGFIVGRATYYDENEFYQINVSEQTSNQRSESSSNKIKTQVIPFFTAESAGIATFVSF